MKDTVTGFILAGIGHRNVEGQNFLIVKPGKGKQSTADAIDCAFS
jgi:vacuolar-type H+-ATPase subunit F/Vma7